MTAGTSQEVAVAASLQAQLRLTCLRVAGFGATPRWGLQKLGVLFGGPYVKEYGILESILGSSHFEKLP